MSAQSESVFPQQTPRLSAASEPPEAGTVILEAEPLPAVGYAFFENGVALLRELTLVSRAETDLTGLTLRIDAAPEFCTGCVRSVERLSAGEALRIRDLALPLDGDFLAGLTEPAQAVLRLSLWTGGTELASLEKNVTLLAFDQWPGLGLYPELLAAYITPQYPAVSWLTAAASGILGEETGDPTLDDYVQRDPERVLAQAGAAFAVMQGEKLTSDDTPAVYGDLTRRLRLPDRALRERKGSILDLGLLYAACLEAMGLRPLLLLRGERSAVGLWLEEMCFPEPVQDDLSQVTKRLSAGIGELAVLDCAALTFGSGADFAGALAAGEALVRNWGTADCVLDVYRARLSGVLALPQQVRNAGAWEIDPSTLPRPASVLSGTGPQPAQEPEGPAAPAGKTAQWERRLLDLGLRNSLINLRLSRTMLPVLTSSLADLEDALADGGDFTVLPRPEDLRAPEGGYGLDNLQEAGDYAGVLRSEFQNRRLRTTCTPAEFNRTVKELYRAAKTALEENGANTLYLALGLLRWYETPRSRKPRYAPVVLLPVELVRRSAAQGYVLRLRDEEPQMNVTVLEKLKQDFHITVNGLDPLPLDEHGIDLDRVFSVLRRAVLAEARWEVLESAWLGIFSFSQFVMWNDLRNRSSDLARNKVVRSLIDGTLAWEASDMVLGDRVSEDGVFLPIAADASQLYAIRAAQAGESFVLHGPPGTGKSQTITALIANALAQGKSVLFVAEKMAALEVVQRRLQKLGLDPFCLELHSNKSRKRDVLDQLRRASEVTKTAPPESYAAKAEQLSALRRDLDRYGDALHALQPWGESLYACIHRFETLRDAPDLTPLDPGFPERTDAAALGAQRAAVERLVAAGHAAGQLRGHPLERVRLRRYSQRLRTAMPAAAGRYAGALNALDRAARDLTAALGLEARTEYGSYRQLAGIAEELIVWQELPAAWARAEDLDGLLAGVRDLSVHARAAEERRAKLLQNWRESFLDQDGQALLTELNRNDARWALGKLLGSGRITRSLAAHAKGPVDKEKLRGEAEALIAYQTERDRTEALYQSCGKSLGRLYRGEAMDWEKLAATADMAAESAARLGDKLRLNHAGDERLLPVLRSYAEAWTALDGAMGEFYALLDIAPQYIDPDWLQGERRLCAGLAANAEALREWVAWNAAAGEAEELGIAPAAEALRNGLDGAELSRAFEKAACLALIPWAIDRSEALGGFSGPVFNESIARFRRLDGLLSELTRKEIFCRLAARVPNFAREAAQSSELGILQKAIRSGGRGMSIRRLFEQIPELLGRLCPCMLMSPISAAQYLDPKCKPFDLVVFDEASQLPTCKAVGALARGENAVVVGDPNQMPPTSFFSASAADEDNLEGEDLESILDDCLAMNMPQTHLLWHYRSRHESLIAFSNSQFYENRLYTFPSARDREAHVHLVPIAGTFTRGGSRQNRAEAEAVVAELRRRCSDPALAGRSVGVVTFNISQQNLIDDLLTETFAADPALERWATLGAEPVFIKNLENVQGDERDVILFSVGYGPDENGKVTMNFGPLNREGGWRRLNVAVSRARWEMVVFSTLTPEQLDLSRTTAQGVAALRLFLAYAAGKPLPRDESSLPLAASGTDGPAEALCRALASAGYRTDRAVGRSAYRVDIGVLDPGDPECYLAGILLDGGSYAAAKTTRDREYAQQSVLEGLGWTVFRVWTMDWWDNPKKETERVLSLIRQTEQIKREAEAASAAKEVMRGTGVEPARSEPEGMQRDADEAADAALPLPEDPAAPEPEQPAQAVPAAPASAEIPLYRPAALPVRTLSADDFISGRYDRAILSAIETVLAQEAPVLESVLTRRVSQSFGLTRVGPRIQEKLAGLLGKTSCAATAQGEDRVLWTVGQDPAAYREFRASGEGEARREPREVPVIEARNAARRALEEQLGLSGEDLVREGAKLLGYVRLGSAVSALLRAAIAQAEREGMIALGANGRWTWL